MTDSNRNRNNIPELNWGVDVSQTQNPIIPDIPQAPQSPVQPLSANTLANASASRQNHVIAARERAEGLLRNNPHTIEAEAMRRQQFGDEYENPLQYADPWTRAISGLESSNEMFRISQAENEGAGFGRGAVDTTTGLVQGLFNAGGSALALGSGLINQNFGAAVAQGTARGSEWFDSLKAEETMERQRIVSLRNQLDEERHRQRMLEEIDNRSVPLVAALRRAGRDYLSSGSRYLDDPTLSAQVAAQGIGSLAGTAGAGGLIFKLMGRGLSRALSEKVAERIIMGTIIGGAEGGDAYTQAMLEVLEADIEDLKANSPEYNRLIEEGYSDEDARIELGQEAGMIAAAVTIPASAAAGALVSRFERNPLRRAQGNRFTDFGRTLGLQTGEETFQEGWTEFSSNLGLRWSGADPDRDLAEGVGEAGAMGGIGGAGMVAGTRGPSLVRGSGRALSNVISNPRSDRNIERNSPVSDTNIQTAIAELDSITPEINETLQSLDQESNVFEPESSENISSEQPTQPTQRDQDREFLNSVLNIPEEESSSLNPALQETIAGKSRAAAIFSMVQELDNNNYSEDDKNQVILYLQTRLKPLLSLLGDELIERAEGYREGLGQHVEHATKTYFLLIQNPKVADALGIHLSQEQIDSLTAQSDENVVMAAEVAPTMVDPARAREVLFHAREGKIKLSPESIRFLTVAAELGERIKAYKDRLDQVFSSTNTENTNSVRDEAIITGRGRDTASLSMVQHIDGILRAVQQNQREEAVDLFEEFRLFRDSMRNKLLAMEQSKKNQDGDGVSYARNTPKGWADVGEKGSGEVKYLLGRGAPKSEALLQNIRADYKAIEGAYNILENSFKDIQPQEQTADLLFTEDTLTEEELQEISREVDEDTKKEIQEAKKEQARRDVDKLPLEQVIQATSRSAFKGIPKVSKRPFTRFLIQTVGRIDPDGPVGTELKNLGITSRNSPGLFKKGGVKNIDNWAMSETQNYEPLLEDDGNGYVSEDQIISILVQEAAGNPFLSIADEQAQFERDAIQEIRDLVEEADFPKEQKRTRKKKEKKPDNQLSFDFTKRADNDPIIEKIKRIIDLHMKDDGTISREHFSNEELKILRDEFGVKTNNKILQLPESIVAETLAVRRALEEASVEQISTQPTGNEKEVSQETSDEQNQTTEQDQEPTAVEEETNSEEQEQDNDQDSDQDIKPEVTLASLVPNVNERFHNSYSLRKNGSTLLQENNPVKAVYEQIKEDTKGGTINEAWRRLLTLPAKIQQNLNHRLNNGEVNRDFVKKLKEGHVFKSGNTVLDTAAGRSLALLNPELTAYDSKITQIAGIAFVHWLLNERKPDINSIDPTDVAEIFRISEEEVTTDMINLVASGNHIQNATYNLSQFINKFLGISPKNDTSRSDAGGITLGLAAEILNAAIELKLISISNEEVTVLREVTNDNGEQALVESPQGYSAVIINNETVLTFQSNMAEAGESNTLEELIVPDADKPIYIGAPKKGVPQYQMKNHETELTSLEKKAIRNEQNKPAKLNMPFINLMKAIGKNTWLDILGYQDITSDRSMNRQHRESVKGKNTSLVYGWEGVMGVLAKAEAWAKENSTTVSEAPLYWGYGISKVGRLQQEGFGPQADKQAREALVFTNTTLNLTDSVQDDQFWMTVAQSIGIKTEKVFRKDAIRRAKEIMSNPLMEEALAPIAFLVQNPGSKLDSKDIATIKHTLEELVDPESKSGIGSITEKTLHAMLSVVMYYDTKAHGDPTKFEHGLSLESDGKTDGPINAIMNFFSGAFSAAQFRLMRMGGFFINQHNMTLNKHFVDGGKDLYEHVANIFEKDLTQKRNTFNDHPELKKALDTVLELISITGNMSFDGEKITIGRNTVKNPLTVSGYGGGKRGIAGKVSKELMDAVYEKFTNALNGKEDVNHIVDQLKFLVNNRAYIGDDGISLEIAPVKNSRDRIGNVNLVSFKLTPKQQFRLTQNIKLLYTDSLVDAINLATHGSARAMDMFQKATQIQALIAKAVFDNKVEELRKTKKPGEDLSNDEYSQIFKEIAPYGAHVYMPTQSLNMGVSERMGAYRPGSSRRTNMVTALGNNSVIGNLPTAQPSEAGVRAAPFMVMGTGDAQMILVLAASGTNGLEKTLMVFDGIEMAADNMDIQSYEINKVVSEHWMKDTSQYVADSFENFLRQNPLNVSYDFEIYKKIGGVILGKPQGLVPKDKLPKILSEYQRELREISDSIRARKETLKEIAHSTDHMASAEQPYNNDIPVILDETGQPLSDQALQIHLNEIYNQKLEEIQAEREANTSTEPNKHTTNTGIVSLVQKGIETIRTSNVPGTKVVSLTVNQMFAAVKPAKNSHQRKMLYSALKSLKSSGYTYHIGTREDLLELASKLSPGAYADITRRQKTGDFEFFGFTDPDNKHIYLYASSTETALHETIHAATLDKVYQALVNPDNSTQATKEAVARLELLMNEFMGYDFSILGFDKSGLDAQEAIKFYLDRNTPQAKAYAINEFMAYTLSNPHLIETLNKTKVRNPLARLALRVLRTIKGLFGWTSIPDNMFANIRFNTEIIMNNELLNNNELFSKDVLYHIAPSDAHTIKVMNRFNRVFRKYIDDINNDSTIPEVLKSSTQRKRIADMTQKVEDLTVIFETAGFDFSPVQRQAFKQIQRAMMTEVELHPPSHLRAQTLFRHVMGNLTPEHFMDDPQSTNPNDIKIAQDKFNALTGAYGTRRDLMGRSSLLGSFLALSQVDPQFRGILQKMKPPSGDNTDSDSLTKSASLKSTTRGATRLDVLLTDTYNNLTNNLSQRLYDGPQRGKSVGHTLDHLMGVLSNIQADNTPLVIKKTNNFTRDADNKTAEIIQSGLNKGIEGLIKIRQDANSRFVKTIAGLLEAVLSIGSKIHGPAHAATVTKLLNNVHVPHVFREFWNELKATDASNEKLHNLINRGKYIVSQTRQNLLEELPNTFVRQFKKKLSKNDWRTLSRTITSIDIGSLLDHYSYEKTRDLISDGRTLGGEITRVTNEIRKISPRYLDSYVNKSEALATYMVTGEITSMNLLTNATSIAKLLGEPSSMGARSSKELVDLIDSLVSLKAIQKINKQDRNLITELMNQEQPAMSFMLAYMQDLHRREKSKTTDPVAQYNHIKGRIDTVRSGTDQLIVRGIGEEAELAKLGYVKLDIYRGDDKDPDSKLNKAYFFSPVRGRSTYHQGALQTVQQTVYGVDAMTGFMVNHGAERITGKEAKKVTRKLMNMRKRDNLPPGEYLKPVFNKKGEIYAYERMMRPDMLAKIRKDEHLATRIGAWAGRQAEEKYASEFNPELIQILGEYWNKEKGTRADEYINLADPEQRDRVNNYVWEVIPKDLKEQIERTFGKDKFMVRRDMLHNALGYPGASVGDFFTGNNRIHPKVNEAIKKALIGILGNRAYEWLLEAENIIQNVVSFAKTNIVIRSVVVPITNIVSNAWQMIVRGVPLSYFGKPMIHKIQETNTYLRNKVRLAEIEAHGIAANAQGDLSRVKTLRARWQAIMDENKRLTIWPLIEKGEFTSISDGLSETDQIVNHSRFMDHVEELASNLPDSVKTVGKYAIVSKDTALYQFLNRSVQYGDFIAKAMVYQHKVDSGMSHEDAHRAVRDEFVNYNLLPGRTRTALEGLGLSWFWNYKVRSVKVAIEMIRDNPLRAFLWALSPIHEIPILGFGDGPLHDNLIGKAISGNLPYTTGPEMMTHVFESNTWIRLSS